MDRPCCQQATHVVIAGDQQTFKAMLQLKKKEATRFRWFTPVPGDWHALVHWLIALDKAWFNGYPLWVHNELGISFYCDADLEVCIRLLSSQAVL